MSMTTERSIATVVNTHHFGSVDKLPAGIVYIGRPGPWGNPYSSKSGKNTKEECVALHRIDLYRCLINNPHYMSQLQEGLKDHDLACWCVQLKKIVACHGYNYLHVLSDVRLTRTYDKSIVHYLMDDLRVAVKQLYHWVHCDVSQEQYLDLYLHVNDVKLSIDYALLILKDKELNVEGLCFFLSSLVVDLELAIRDKDGDMIAYRLDHVMWNITRFTSKVPEIFPEPLPPLPKKG